MKEPDRIRYVTRTYQYDPADRIISITDDRSGSEVFEYDRSGNLVSRTAPGISPGQQNTAGQAPVPARRFCPQCGAPLHSGTRFCGTCGAPVT